MPETIVALEKCQNYDPAGIESALRKSILHLGGAEKFIDPGQKVLLKVNLLNASAPERAVTTHPEILRAVIRLVKEAGGQVTVGDSPGGRNVGNGPKKVFAATGIGAVCEQEGVPLVLFDSEVVKVNNPDAKLYTSFTVGKAVVDADVVITLPRLKTHSFQMFTGAVKNLFGSIPGLKKAEYHVKVPDRDDFADMLIDLYLLIRPKLAIMDGIVAMEGDGPSAGSPHHLGLILASGDAVALDFIATKIVGFDPYKVYTNLAAINRGLLEDPEAIEVAGLSLEDSLAVNFVLPNTEAGGNLPPFIREHLNDILIDKPELASAELCDGCRTCYQNCPVKAITMKDKKPVFDYDVCIRCYCCQELCPTHAIGLKKHWMVRAWKTARG